ncbi:MAG: adenylate/guanylate cyclase domain-containing protein [Proteobacteria bacterium]|nr:adenylate/guanylate cyclase domain-containing protein [Pseudomonadota bacterium]
MSVRLRVLALLVALATLLSALYGALMSWADDPLDGVARGVTAGLPISLAIGLFEAYVVDGPAGRRMRAAPFMVAAGSRFAVWCVAILAGLVFMRSAFPDVGEAGHGYAADILFSFALIAVALSYLSIDRLLGNGNLWRLLIGRYHRPRAEARIFLFLDMEGSTAAAEKLGAPRFLELLAGAVLDATPPIRAARGEIYRYVGDEIVVTWPIARADDAVKGAIATIAALDALAPDYTARFGVAPRFRGGLHGGTVAVGEIGDVRREIVYLGDAVNVAKRLETEAGTRRARLLVSGDVVASLRDAGLRARLTDLGDIPIIGRAAPLRTYVANT